MRDQRSPRDQSCCVFADQTGALVRAVMVCKAVGTNTHRQRAASGAATGPTATVPSEVDPTD
jgi:hypothetical protein